MGEGEGNFNLGGLENTDSFIDSSNETQKTVEPVSKNVDATYEDDRKKEQEPVSLEATWVKNFFTYLENKIGKLDNEYKNGKVGDPKEYLKRINDLSEEELVLQKNSPEAQNLTFLFFDSASVIRSQFIRDRKEPKTAEILAIREAQWQIGLAKYYLENSATNRAVAVEVIKMCERRYKKTCDALTYDNKHIDGVIRGLHGLLASVIMFKKYKFEIILPTGEQDALDGIDLMTIDRGHNIKHLIQLKTVAVPTSPFVDHITGERKVVGGEEEQKYTKGCNKLFRSGQEMQRRDGELTIKTSCITIPEPEIRSNFSLESDFDKKIIQQL